MELKNWRSHRHGPWPLRLKLGLALSNGHRVNGTHHGELKRLGIGDRRMAKNSRDSRRENKLIMGHRILINIYKGKHEVRGKVYGNPLNEG